ncbi:SpoIIE family protein phosphatase [Streptomyces canus]|nr:SpoIIE family protein phosphatase [Streptomyces canus]
MPADELFSRLNDLVSDPARTFTPRPPSWPSPRRAHVLVLPGRSPPAGRRPPRRHRPQPHVTPEPPLGAAVPPFKTHHLHLPTRAFSSCCTDGLLESATRDTDEGLTNCGRWLPGPCPTPPFEVADEDDAVRRLEELCNTIVAALLPDHGQTNDDARLIVVHTRCTPARDVLTRNLREDPRSAGQSRT